MKKIIKFEICFIFISLVVIPAIVQSVSLGSFTRKNSATVEAGEKITFDVLFWNLADDPYYLKLHESNIPDGWRIRIEQNDFLMETTEIEKPPFGNNDYINLPNIGVIMPHRVEIEIQTSSNTKEGNYEIFIIATTSKSNKDISVSQERDINFKIKVLNNQEENENENLDEQEETSNQNIQTKKITALKATQENNNETLKKEENNTEIQNKENKSPLTGRFISTLSSSLKNRNFLILIGVIFTILGCLVIYKYV